MGACELPKILDLLPEGFQSDDMVVGASEILHQLISSFEKDKALEIIVPDEIKNVLINQSYSNKGVMNWFNYYQPYLGSDKFIEYLLKLSNVNTTILPWYETDNPTNTFDLILDKYPESINPEHLLTLINTYKNIEAKLASVRMADCPIRFTLDNSSLDYDILSDTAGYSINGTTFCFRNISKQEPIQISQTEFAMLRTKTTSLRLAYPHHETLDNTILGDKNIILEPSTQRMIVKTDPVEPITYNLGEAYNWRTFKAQQVLSDYGSLSGGEGFIGKKLVHNDVYLDELKLSDNIPYYYYIIDNIWNATKFYIDIEQPLIKSVGSFNIKEHLNHLNLNPKINFAQSKLKILNDYIKLKLNWNIGLTWDSNLTWDSDYTVGTLFTKYSIKDLDTTNVIIDDPQLQNFKTSINYLNYMFPNNFKLVKNISKISNLKYKYIPTDIIILPRSDTRSVSYNNLTYNLDISESVYQSNSDIKQVETDIIIKELNTKLRGSNILITNTWNEFTTWSDGRWFDYVVVSLNQHTSEVV